MSHAGHSMNSTTPATIIATDENQQDLLAQETHSFSEHHQAMLFSSGENSSTSASTTEPEGNKRALTAPRFGTLERTRAANSYAKRTRLLIESGLIAGITPTSIRKRLGADCREHASSLLVGDMYAKADTGREPKADC